MQIILDSNILFSALIKDSIIRKIILNFKGFFLFPSFIFEELEKHYDELIKKSRLNKDEFEDLLDIILSKVLIVPSEVLLKHKKEALEIVKDIDVDDVIFIACALAYDFSVVWSNDKNLKKQDSIKVCNTKEIIELLKILN
ncbi:PIN domain-containing protein [Candidatus Woesearchaeota archaeon]|nr:PIN domain-containing protein [Candidatus Woesearchaeota archaeon]